MAAATNDDDDARDAAAPAVKRLRCDPATTGVTGMRNYTLLHGAALMTPSSVYGELELQEASRRVKGVRVRQHVNPLTERFQRQAPAPVWTEAFADVTRPLTIDIGCGGGRFDLLYAKRHAGTRNILGVDVRAPLVERGSAWGEAAGVVDNVHFAECNATVSIGEWIKSYNACGEGKGVVDLVCAQFCDPHFKKKHRKRRIVQKTLVEQLARELTPGARVFLQSDVKELTEDMRDKFERFGGDYFDLDDELYDADVVKAKIEAAANAPSDASATEAGDGDDDGWRSTWAHAGWLDENPLGIPTEREVQTTGEGLPVFRIMLQRNAKVFATPL
jgi:tRNA (guanine-N7-)-methyltransferase